MSNVDFRGLLARTVQIAAGIGALYLCAMKLLGPRYAISKATFAMFTVTPALMWMRQLLGFGELIAGLSILFGWTWEAFGGVSTGAAAVVMCEVMVVIIARHFYGAWLIVETSALVLYSVLFVVSGFIERPLGLETPLRSSAADVKRLNAFRPPNEEKADAADDDVDDDATAIDRKEIKKRQ